MDYLVRKPDFQVEIVRPDYASPTYTDYSVVKFISSPIDSADPLFSTALISYRFSESLHTIDSDFSLTVTLEEDDQGRTWMDKIEKRDLVFISEFGQTRFAGIVEDIRYSANILDDGSVNRVIIISGVNLLALLSSFKLVFNQALYASDRTASIANLQLLAKLSQEMKPGGQVRNIIKAIYDNFFELTLKMGTTNYSGAGIKTILDNYIDFNDKLSKDIVLRYPIQLSIYNSGENDIWNILTSLLVPPVDELYGLWNSETRKYEAVFRQTPFEPEDWKNLTKNYIPSILVTDHDLGSSTSEVYTYYLSIIAGSGYNKDEAVVYDAAGYAHYAEKDKEKWRKYGFRPMIIEFKYFDKNKIGTQEEKDAFKLMGELSKMLKRWFEHNDEFLSGSITFMTIDEKWWSGEIRNPRIGEKIGFLDGEFYVEESEHSWNYGGPMITRLSVTRGYKYSATGEMIGPIDNLGRKLASIAKGYDRFWGMNSSRGAV